jgi:hypothetical protein
MSVDYVTWAIGGGANVYLPATYQANPLTGTGVTTGLADPQLYNTTLRLASMMSAALGNYIANQLGISVNDDGNLSNLITNLTNAINSPASVKPARIVTASSTLNLSCTTDFAIGLNRTAGQSAMTINLANSGVLVVGQEFSIADLSNNMNTYPATITPPGGHSIAGLSTYVMNINRGKNSFKYYGSSIWDVK